MSVLIHLMILVVVSVGSLGYFYVDMLRVKSFTYFFLIFLMPDNTS